MTRRVLIAIPVLLGLVGGPLVALDCEPGGRDAMPCCQGDASSCHQEVGQVAECCSVSPAGPEGDDPALKVERTAPSSVVVVAVLLPIPAPAPPGVAGKSAAPLVTSPSRPTVLRL